MSKGAESVALIDGTVSGSGGGATREEVVALAEGGFGEDSGSGVVEGASSTGALDDVDGVFIAPSVVPRRAAVRRAAAVSGRAYMRSM